MKYFIILAAICSAALAFTGCASVESVKPLHMDSGIDLGSLTKIAEPRAYSSAVKADVITESGESMVRITAIWDQKHITYFLQPDEVAIDMTGFDFEAATIIDIRKGLMVQDHKTGKTFFGYLTGKLDPHDLPFTPDISMPLAGLSKYMSQSGEVDWLAPR